MLLVMTRYLYARFWHILTFTWANGCPRSDSSENIFAASSGSASTPPSPAGMKIINQVKKNVLVMWIP